MAGQRRVVSGRGACSLGFGERRAAEARAHGQQRPADMSGGGERNEAYKKQKKQHFYNNDSVTMTPIQTVRCMKFISCSSVYFASMYTESFVSLCSGKTQTTLDQ